MSTTWDTYHHRIHLLDHVVAYAERTGRLHEPWRDQPVVWDEFVDVDDLLRTLHGIWHRTLSGAVSLAREEAGLALRQDVERAYHAAADRHRALVRVLEANADHPTLAPLLRRDRLVMAAAAGCNVSDLDLTERAGVPQQRGGRLRRLLFREA